MDRAPRRCSHCPNLIPQGEDCSDHPRRQWIKRPGDVNRNRTSGREALKRIHVGPEKKCALAYAGCTGIATELDRVDRRGGYTLDNVAGCCHSCHMIKTSREGNAAQGHNVADVSRETTKTRWQPDHQPEQHAPRFRRIDIAGPPVDHDSGWWPQPWD